MRNRFSVISAKHRICWLALCSLLLSTAITQAQLAVIVAPPKITGQKAIVQLKMKNNLNDPIKSARAVCFLLDEQGKMVGQSTKWVIGQNKTNLAIGATNEFNFVINSPKPFISTNLAAKVSFSRVVLDGAKLVDVQRDVVIVPAAK